MRLVEKYQIESIAYNMSYKYSGAIHMYSCPFCVFRNVLGIFKLCLIRWWKRVVYGKLLAINLLTQGPFAKPLESFHSVTQQPCGLPITKT